MKIPKHIIDTIHTQWFYVYEWINYKHIIHILKQDLSNILIKNEKYLMIFLFLFSLSAIPFFIHIENIIFLIYVFWFLWFSFFLYIIWRWYKYAYISRKNMFIIITSSSIILNWKILSLSDNITLQNELDSVETTFQTKLFLENETILSYKNLEKHFRNSFFYIYEKKLGSIVFFLLLWYIIYIFFISFVYIIGSIFVSIFSIIIWNIIKYYQKLIWNIALKIQDLFSLIEISSSKIKKQNEILNIYFKENNLKSIEEQLKLTHKYIQKSLHHHSILKTTLKNSIYREIYDYQVYNKWIKNELLMPLEHLQTLLVKNAFNIEKQLDELEDLLKKNTWRNKNIYNLQKMNLNLLFNTINAKINEVNYFINQLKDQ